MLSEREMAIGCRHMGPKSQLVLSFTSHSGDNTVSLFLLNRFQIFYYQFLHIHIHILGTCITQYKQVIKHYKHECDNRILYNHNFVIKYQNVKYLNYLMTLPNIYDRF